MFIRRIRETDLDGLILLYEHLHTNDIKPSKDLLAKVWQDLIHNSHFIYFVVEEDDKLVSSCNLTIIPNLTRGGRSIGLIENVVTHKDYRGKGFGKAVMSTTIEFAKELNCYKIMLLSNVKRKDAHKFYENLGFRSDDKVGFVMKL